MSRHLLALALAVSLPAGAQRPGAGFCPRTTTLPNPAIRLDTAVLTADLPAVMTSCEAPPALARMRPGVSTVNFWFLVRGVQAGDQPRVDWIAPDGGLYTFSSWPSLPSSGDFCFYAPLPAAFLEGRAGRWQARLHWNGQTLATRNLDVPSPDIEQALVTTLEPVGCTVAEASTLLGELPESVYAYTRFAGLPPPRLRFEWLDRDLNLLASQTVAGAATSCVAARFRLAGASRPPGDYAVRIYDSDRLLTTLRFTAAAAQVDEIRMVQNYPDSCQADSDSPAYSSLADKETITWVRLRTGGQTGLLVFDYFDPDGQRVTSAGATLAPTTESQCVYGVTPLRPELSTNYTGEWRVRLSLEGEALAEKTFTVGPVLLHQLGLTREADGCMAPRLTRSYVSTEPKSVLWFQVRAARPGERPAVEWISPSGHPAGGVDFAPVRDAGDYCYAAELPLEGLDPGFWRANLRWQDQPLASRTFFLGRARLEDIRLTDVNRACEPPPEKTVFSASDAQALLWFVIEESGAADAAVIEWVAPSGTVVRTESWNVFASGRYYFTSRLPLAGTQPRGAWRARVKWNGAVLCEMPFMVE